MPSPLMKPCACLLALVTFAAGAYSDVVVEGFDQRERAVGAETPIHGYLGLSLGGHVDLGVAGAR